MTSPINSPHTTRGTSVNWYLWSDTERHPVLEVVKAKEAERGASLVEYALLIGLIALVCIVALVFFGSSLSNNSNTAGSSMKAAGS